MKFWFAVPFVALMLAPAWLDSLYERGLDGPGIARDEGGVGIPQDRIAEGGVGIPQDRVAEGGVGIPQ